MSDTTDRARVNINVPFSGFYESIWSGEIDREQESHVEHMLDEDCEDGEMRHAPEVRLTAEELHDILNEITNYQTAYTSIASMYVDAFAHAVQEHAEINLGWTYESMSSPKYYNFSTDRLFADVPLNVMQGMFDASAAEKHVTLGAQIKERHSSYSGFHSHYSNDLAEWLEKPLEDWDHNELCTLLVTALARPRWTMMSSAKP